MSAASILASLGTAVGIALALSPLPTIRTIISNKSIGEFSVFPYIVTFCQCVLWMTYAGVTPGKSSLFPVNGFVSAVELGYVIIFVNFVNPEQRMNLIKLILIPTTAMMVSILLSLVSPNPSKVVGFFAVLSNIVMYGAPLAVVKIVIETKSVKYMPFLLSFVGTIASIIWSSWAYVANDSFVLVPNIVGVILGLIQLGVYAKFRNAQPEMIIEESRLFGDEKGGLITSVVTAKV